MKIIGTILVGFFLVACAPAPTLEQLEDQAILTGNWSQVEKRERSIARRQARQQLQCFSGYVAYCDGDSGRKQCNCVSWQALNAGLQSDW